MFLITFVLLSFDFNGNESFFIFNGMKYLYITIIEMFVRSLKFVNWFLFSLWFTWFERTIYGGRNEFKHFMRWFLTVHYIKVIEIYKAVKLSLMHDFNFRVRCWVVGLANNLYCFRTFLQIIYFPSSASKSAPGIAYKIRRDNFICKIIFQFLKSSF